MAPYFATALILAAIVTVPVHVGIRVPDSVTINLPSTILLPTPAPQLTAGASPRPGATPVPGAPPPPSATQAMADKIAAQITNQLAESMGTSQTKPQVSVEYVPSQPTSPLSTPSPSGGDYVATINF